MSVTSPILMPEPGLAELGVPPPELELPPPLPLPQPAPTASTSTAISDVSQTSVRPVST